MKIKTIKKVLNSKLKEWLDSISDTKVKDAVVRSAIVTGGSIPSMLLKEPVNDFDIYFKNTSDLKIVLNYYKQEISKQAEYLSLMSRSTIISYGWDGKDILEEKLQEYYNKRDDEVGFKNIFNGAILSAETCKKDQVKVYIGDAKGFWRNEYLKEDKKYQPAFITTNALSLTDDIQIITRFTGSVEEIHKNFDFIHATNYFDFQKNKLVLKQDALESIITKDLVYQGSLYPVTSIIRAKKFINRGWTINAGQYLKMALQVSDLNLRDIKVLEEQLIGVDIAYFEQLIEAFRNMSDDKIDKDTGVIKVDYTYLAVLIDKFFNGDDDE